MVPRPPQYAAVDAPRGTDGPVKLLQNYIDGRFVRGAREFADVNPADGSVIAQVSEANSGLVDEAVAAARQALNGEWGRLPVPARAALLHKIAERNRGALPGFSRKRRSRTPASLSRSRRSIDVPRARQIFAHLQTSSRPQAWSHFEPKLPTRKSALNYAVRKPLGVVGIVTPWNLPLLLLTWKVAPALACGNCVVVKPSEETPATATLLAEVMQKRGCPQGVFNLGSRISALIQRESSLTAHPDVDAITFTGESQHRSGDHAMQLLPPVKPVSFELGGKNAAIVFADCDFDETVTWPQRRSLPQYRPSVPLRRTCVRRAPNSRSFRVGA